MPRVQRWATSRPGEFPALHPAVAEGSPAATPAAARYTWKDRTEHETTNERPGEGNVDREQRAMIDELRRRLEGRAWLSVDGAAYRDGVEDALDEVAVLLDDHEAATAAGVRTPAS
jgi:hypothetical protein